MTEKEKMLLGKLYYSDDLHLTKDREQSQEKCFRYNNLSPIDKNKRNMLIKTIITNIGEDFNIESPFYCDYGYNIIIGDKFYSNYNCVILDCARVKIGNNVMFGPNVNIYTAGHPVDSKLRDSGLEYAFPVTIGDSVWVGGGCIINPGISIGNNVVIGSGSVVTKNIPSNVIAAGNPCKVIREITDKDKEYYFKNLKI